MFHFTTRLCDRRDKHIRKSSYCRVKRPDELERQVHMNQYILASK